MSFWFPPKDQVTRSQLIDVKTVHDIDQASELHPGDHLRTQLSTGGYSGKILSGNIGGVTHLIESSSQDIEWETHVAKNVFSFSLVLEQRHEISTYGVRRDASTVLVMPPRSAIHTVFAAHGTIGVIAVDPTELLSSKSLLPEAADWLVRLEKRGEFIQSSWLAERLRDDLRHLTECSVSANATRIQEVAGTFAVTSIANALSLEFLRRRYENVLKRPPSFETFWQMRANMLEQLSENDLNLFDLAPNKTGSKRTIENMFSRNVGLAPMRYFRVLRLNRTRQKLLDRSRLKESIGDIACEEGFWDWSRFSAYYLRQFGERPSETRMRAAS
ncbi:helix-turn-helix domain-containing protein [Roseibium sp.]|uniref:helix-turn-helix domain-containing protein n=1 Tax=Roseibium sp. TaxID=1936156 RepID=UPI003B50410D